MFDLWTICIMESYLTKRKFISTQPCCSQDWLLLYRERKPWLHSSHNNPNFSIQEQWFAGNRWTTTSKRRKKCCEPSVLSFRAKYVLDNGAHIHKVKWAKKGIYQDIVKQYVSYVHVSMETVFFFFMATGKVHRLMATSMREVRKHVQIYSTYRIHGSSRKSRDLSFEWRKQSPVYLTTKSLLRIRCSDCSQFYRRCRLLLVPFKWLWKGRRSMW